MKYPIKYICGAGVMNCPSEKFERRAKFLETSLNQTAPILGETGIDGVLLDFNYGLRLQIPEGNWHVRIADAESEYVFFDEDVSRTTLISWEKFLIEWEITIWKDGEPVFYHQFDPRRQNVHFKFMRSMLGDTLALLPYIEAFRKQFDCAVSCSIAEAFHGIVEHYYPNLRLTEELPDDSYACFYMWMTFNLPFSAIEDAARISLLRMGQAILRHIKRPPKVIFTPTKSREIAEPYVCIGVQGSSPSKGWLAPGGWDEVVDYLRSLDYRVLCIDQHRVCSDQFNAIEMPRGAEDMSGNYTLLDRINQLAYADFFIGISSGLSWLAWAVDIPVVMISGITKPWHEFDTPYRINNPLVCHGCFNDFRERDIIHLCPLFKGTKRAFECSKKISARQVINAIDRLIADQKLMGGNNIDSSD